jgi:hypothetical protein
MALGTGLGVEGDHLLVFFAIRTMVEANQHTAIADVRPTSDENKVGDLKRQTLWRIAPRSSYTPLAQMAHNAAQATTNVVASIKVVR